MESEEQRLVYYHDWEPGQDEKFNFTLSLLVPKVQSNQLLVFESRRREFEWNIEVNIGDANITVTINSISNLSGKRRVDDLYMPALLEPFVPYTIELYVTDNDEFHFVLIDPELTQLETNLKLAFDDSITTLPAPDRITIGDGLIGCVENINWIGKKLTFDTEKSLRSGDQTLAYDELSIDRRTDPQHKWFTETTADNYRGRMSLQFKLSCL